MKKVVATFEAVGGMELEQEILGDFAEIIKATSYTEEEVIENCKDADAVMTEFEPFTAHVIENLPKLKIIAARAIGVNSIDLDAAKKKGIAVTNIPNYCINEVADHTLALMLAINRRLMQFHKSVQEDKIWQPELCPDMKRFGEETIGLLGFGNIPRLIAKRVASFGATVIAYDPFVSKEVADEYGVKLVTLDELCETADYISGHLPLNKSTEELINKELFDKMKKGVVFINTGRGKTVDEEALIEALDSGKVGYAALDVLVEEYPDLNTHPLVGRENVILTPHVAFYSLTSMRDSQIEVTENILHYLKGEYEKCSIINGVNV